MEAQRRRDPLPTVMAQGQCLRVMLRRKLAVSKDWSKIGAIRKLVLPASDRIPVITGVGLPMGIYSGRTPKDHTRSRGLPREESEQTNCPIVRGLATAAWGRDADLDAIHA
jgi:hypothetical protein